MATGLKVLLTICVLCIPQLAAAELPDPTRPAIDLTGGGGGSEAVETEAAPRGLQTIIISPHYRAAIINGETVRLGGKVGDSRLVEVRDGSVVLQNAQGRQVLELFPKVNINKEQPVQPAGGAQGQTGRQAQPEEDVGGSK